MHSFFSYLIINYFWCFANIGLPTPGNAELCWRSPGQVYEETSTCAQSRAGPQTTPGSQKSITSQRHLTWVQHQIHLQHPDHVFPQGNKVWDGDREVTE